MAISNIQDTLLMYTKQKSMINEKISDVMFNMMNASRQSAELQSKFNDKQQYYYYEYYENSPDQYEAVMEILEKDHEFELANINSWESQLEMEKNSLETRLNEITTFESSWTKLLQGNIKNDFTYGGSSK